MIKKQRWAIVAVAVTAFALGGAVVPEFIGDERPQPASIAAPANRQPEAPPAAELELQHKNKWRELLDAAGRCSLQQNSSPDAPQVIFGSENREVAVRIVSGEGSIEILVLTDESMQIHLKQAGGPNRSLKPVAEDIDAQLRRALPTSPQQSEAWELEFLAYAQRGLASSTSSDTLNPQRMCER